MEFADKRCGWKFPLQCNARTGKIETTDPAEDIRQSIRILLSTLPGERLLRETYGCNLHRFIFEPLSYHLLQQIRTEVTQCLLRWEKRIENLSVEALPAPEASAALTVTVRYTIRETGAPDLYTYPLNLLESSGERM